MINIDLGFQDSANLFELFSTLEYHEVPWSPSKYLEIPQSTLDITWKYIWAPKTLKVPLITLKYIWVA